MNNETCYRCATSESTHPFNICMTVSCLCACVQQLKNFCNVNQDDISDKHPRFLEINNQEARTLPNGEEQINKFNRVNKLEWLKDPSIVDGRRKKKL